MTTWLLEKPSSQMSTCAQKQEAEDGDVTELYMNSRGLYGKERLAFISAKPSCPLHLLLCSSSTFLRCAPTPVAVKRWLLPTGWTLGSASPQSQSLLAILGKGWFQQHEGGRLPRAAVDGKPGRRRLKAQEPTGTCKARSTLGLGTGCCPGLRLCAHLTVHLGKVPLTQAVPPQSAMAEKVTVRFNSVLCCCSARWHQAPLQGLGTEGGAGS